MKSNDECGMMNDEPVLFILHASSFILWLRLASNDLLAAPFAFDQKCILSRMLPIKENNANIRTNSMNQ